MTESTLKHAIYQKEIKKSGHPLGIECLKQRSGLTSLKKPLNMNHPRMKPEMNSSPYHLIDNAPKHNISGLTYQFTTNVSNIVTSRFTARRDKKKMYICTYVLSVGLT